jgi:predicted transcriptional regulator
MTPKDLVINCVIQYRKPFSVEKVAGLTDLDVSEVEAVFSNLQAQQLIKRISTKESIYVYTQRIEVSRHNSRRTDWIYNLREARRLLAVLSTKHFTSIRTIASEIDKSRQWVFRYLEALASVGAIAYDKYGYYAVQGADINKLGMHIIPGILSQLQRKYWTKYRKGIVKEPQVQNRELQQHQKLALKEFVAFFYDVLF